MLTALFGSARTLLEGSAHNFALVLRYPLDPSGRIFVPYLATSLALALFAYRAARRRAPARGMGGAAPSLSEFLFPREVWRTPSAWLDVRYFFFHQIFRVFLYGGFVAAVSGWTLAVAARLLGASPGSGTTTPARSWLDFGYLLVSVAVMDFVAFAIHYCQHRIPLLWEFHRVHHSARVLHPLTNYREHPVDNIAYATGYGVGSGALAAVASALLGHAPAEPAVMSAGLSVFLFNALGYNLRHSHIWLRWPGPLVYLIGCPAHHQVHHSYHPDHVDKNFAFLLPVWDVLFGTFALPESGAELAFGLGEDPQEEFTSCLGLYWVPFRNVASRRR